MNILLISFILISLTAVVTSNAVISVSSTDFVVAIKETGITLVAECRVICSNDVCCDLTVTLRAGEWGLTKALMAAANIHITENSLSGFGNWTTSIRWFITKVDRSYSFQCYYMESEKTVATQLDISELTSIFQTQRVPMPICRYEVLDAQPPTGQPIKYAIVGQALYHRWVCETDAKDIFCMTVNSCYVYDGLGDQAQLLDSTGCAVDRYLLQNIQYTSDLSAVREAHVFKFADRTAVYFQCQIAITVREPTSVCPRPACATTTAPGASGDSTAASASAGGYTSTQTSAPQAGNSDQNYNFPTPGQDFTLSAATATSSTSPAYATASPGYGTVSAGTVSSGTVAFSSTTSSLYHTTTTAPFRPITAQADDPTRLNETARVHGHRSMGTRPRRRKERLADDIPTQADNSFDELGVWDVRAPYIAVFDLDDANGPRIKHNASGTRPNLASSQNESCANEDELNFCFSFHLFIIILILGFTPSCALTLACFIRYMKRRSGKW